MRSDFVPAGGVGIGGMGRKGFDMRGVGGRVIGVDGGGVELVVSAMGEVGVGV